MDPPSGEHNKPKPTSSDLFSSAKVVAGAAQSALNRDTDKLDKAKVAGAADDLLEAAAQYGKLDKDKGLGQYVEKAEGYLHQYGSSQPATATTASGHFEPAKEQPPSKESGGDGEPGSGLGDYVKMAKGFLKK